MTLMFHESNERNFSAVCQVSFTVPTKLCWCSARNNEWMGQSLVAWPLPGNHSSANNRALLNPYSVHISCPSHAPTSLSQWVTWAEPYAARKWHAKSDQTFVPKSHACWAVVLRKPVMFLPGRDDGCRGRLMQIHRKRLAQRHYT